MAGTRKPRRKYRPGAVHTNTVQLALRRASKLARADVLGQHKLQQRALAEFAAGQHCAAHWRTLADAANMAETLAGIGIGTGADAKQIINDAQHALAAVAQRHQDRRTWTLYAGELDALRWLIALHGRQLAECSYGEFDAAYTRTANRLSQALAGNAAADAVVVVGDVIRSECNEHRAK
jgi:hypothetical protein